MAIYTNAADIEDKILNDYHDNDVELNSLFFDFDVKMQEKELLELYADIQQKINGDTVMRLENIQAKDDEVWGEEAENLIPDGMHEDVYEGNYKDFLESFNDREKETGLCRFMDVEEKGDLIGGIKLDFVF